MTPECDCKFVVDINSKFNFKPGKHYQTCAINIKKRVEKGEFPNGPPRDAKGCLNLTNPYLKDSDKDVLYHIGLDTHTNDLKQMFGDVKFVCMGGTSERMKEFATAAIEELGIKLPNGCGLVDLGEASHRYSFYKLGPIISINHGIGMSTMSVVLNEIIKLLQYSKANDPIMFRIGTSGGIDVEPGSVIISSKAYNGLLKETFDLATLGKSKSWPAIFDECLVHELQYLCKSTDEYKVLTGGTMGAEDFYNGQGRTDGAFSEHTQNDKMNFLHKLKEIGIKNVEMEAPCFAALTHKAGIKAADVCVTLLNRLHGDQVTTPKDLILEYQKRPIQVVLNYIKQYLISIDRYPYGLC